MISKKLEKFYQSRSFQNPPRGYFLTILQKMLFYNEIYSKKIKKDILLAPEYIHKLPVPVGSTWSGANFDRHRAALV